MTNPKAVRGLTAQILAAALVNFLEITDILSHSGRHQEEIFRVVSGKARTEDRKVTA